MKRLVEKTWHKYLVISSVFAVYGGALDAAEVRTIFPADDAYVSSAEPATNFSASHQLRIKDADGEINRSYLNFDLTSVTEGVRNAYIEFHRNSFGDVDVVPVELWRSAPNWSESGITWESQPQLTTRIAPRYSSKSNFVRFDVTKLVTEKAGGWMSVALSVEQDPNAEVPVPSELAVVVHSNNSTTEPFKPRLIVQTEQLAGSVFDCARVMGFSQTRQWFEGGNFLSHPLIDAARWEANAIGGCGTATWLVEGSCADGIWSPTPSAGACAVRSGAPDRLLLAVSGDVEEDWAQLSKNAIDEARKRLNSNDGDTHLNPQKMYLLPVIGGANNAYCDGSRFNGCSGQGGQHCVSVGADIQAVRASYNNPEITSALGRVAGSEGYEDVYYLHDLEVGCEIFGDAKGHFNSAGTQSTAADAAAQLIHDID